MTKRLVDVDDDLVDAASRLLGTATLKDTVNGALADAVRNRRERVRLAIDVLSDLAEKGALGDRSEAW